MFDFSQGGGALQMLGHEQLGRISSRTGLKGDITTLAAHLDEDDDLGVEPATHNLIYSCGCLVAQATEQQQAAARAAADGVAAAAAQQHAHSHGWQQQQRRAQNTPAAALMPGVPDPTGLTAAEVFSLSSRPQSKYKLVLDFDGNTLIGGAWNSVKKTDKIVTPPYDKDGDNSTFNAEELADIVAIWRAVAEDFAPFDVDVTTADPGDAALTGVGQKAIIGGHSTDWYGVAGGIAFVNSFGRPDLPCFIFPRSLGPNNPKFIWEAVSHELGHTLGLLHDGVLPNPAMPSGTAYYSGQGVWAPLMGIPYYAEVTTWDAGEYPFSNNNQDDLATIGRFLPRAPAQFGSSVSTASPLTATSSSSPSETATATASGVLSSSNQTDFFSFAAAAGPASITVAVTAPFGVGYYGRSNLNAVSTVFDATGAVLATFNPPGPENMGIAAANVTIPSSGVYYVSVAGSGEGNVSIDGYSSYASLGRYSVSVTYASGFTPPAVDCMGAWSSWSVCNASCNQTMTFRITRPAANGGGACVSADGSVRSQPCSGGACLAAIDDPIVIIADITISRETFNMSTNSTNGTAPANGTNNTTVRANSSGSASPQYAFCKAVVTLKTKAGARLAKAKISGSWSDIDVARSKPTVAAPTSLQTRPSGQVVFKSRPWRADLQPPQQPAQNGAISACVFTVSGVDFPGKTLDRAASVLTQKLTFDGR
uniref:Peptidase C-terminal archaeal/bacterial domain-containing protein n=1 Tax=Tetradesmus obliquus TaxID=3088 RepID=A0A383V9Q0_TETOB|eukprot:jgi/Sobl393_1/6565/SZX62298.1